MQGLQKQVGARIRQLREKKGLSQEAFADVCNLHRTYIGLIERGQRNLSVGTIERIASALGVPVADLFAGLEAAALTATRKLGQKRGAFSDDPAAHIAAIRQILIDANLTDAKRYETLVKANRKRRR